MPAPQWNTQQRLPPGIKIDIAIPEDKAEVAISRLRELATGLNLILSVVKHEPDPLIPNAIYHEIAILATSMPQTPEEMEIISNNLMQFQGLLSTAIIVANTPEEELLKLAKEQDLSKSLLNSTPNPAPTSTSEVKEDV